MNRRWIGGVLLGFLLALGLGSVFGGLPRTFHYTVNSFMWLLRSKAPPQRINVGATATIVTFPSVSKGVWVKNESATESLRLCDDPTGYTPTSTLGILLDPGDSWTHPYWVTESMSAIRVGSADLSATFRPEYHVE